MWRLAIVFRAAGRSVCSGGSSSEGMAKGKFFYAVRKGFKPGVYGTWDECKTQVDKFPSAAYKKFASEKDAWAFVRGVQSGAASASGSGALGDTAACDYSLLPRRVPEPEHCFPLGKKRCQSQQEAEPHPKRAKQTEMSDGYTYMGDAVVVYTDGCCSYNGKKGARAGIGVYWGPNHPLCHQLGAELEGERVAVEVRRTSVQQRRLHEAGRAEPGAGRGLDAHPGSRRLSGERGGRPPVQGRSRPGTSAGPRPGPVPLMEALLCLLFSFCSYVCYFVCC
ncbi:ribonuclease H1 isoform 3-T3 [Synchiropus picturatus]